MDDSYINNLKFSTFNISRIYTSQTKLYASVSLLFFFEEKNISQGYEPHFHNYTNEP